MNYTNKLALVLLTTAKEYYSGANMLNFTNRQIEEFVENAKLQNINWIDE